MKFAKPKISLLAENVIAGKQHWLIQQIQTRKHTQATKLGEEFTRIDR